MDKMIQRARNLLQYMTFKDVCCTLASSGYEATKDEIYLTVVAAKILNS